MPPESPLLTAVRLPDPNQVTRAHRLLIYWRYDLAWPGWVEVTGGLLSFRLPTAVWCGSHLACVRRSPWRGEAQEGSAQLEEALPSSLTSLGGVPGAV